MHNIQSLLTLTGSNNYITARAKLHILCESSGWIWFRAYEYFVEYIFIDRNMCVCVCTQIHAVFLCASFAAGHLGSTDGCNRSTPLDALSVSLSLWALSYWIKPNTLRVLSGAEGRFMGDSPSWLMDGVIIDDVLYHHKRTANLISRFDCCRKTGSNAISGHPVDTPQHKYLSRRFIFLVSANSYEIPSIDPVNPCGTAKRHTFSLVRNHRLFEQWSWDFI